MFSATKQENTKIMTLNSANNLFERLNKESTKKSEIKVYEKFLDILSKLKNRELPKDDIKLIEMKLDHLNLESNPPNRKKFFKKALSQFEKYLKETFSLTSKGYYADLGIALGSSFGILFGVVFLWNWERSLGISLGLIAGMGIGRAIGIAMDSQAKTAGNML